MKVRTLASFTHPLNVISLVISSHLFPSVEWLTTCLFPLESGLEYKVQPFINHTNQKQLLDLGPEKKPGKRLVKVLTKSIPFVAKIFGGENGCEWLEVRLELGNHYTDVEAFCSARADPQVGRGLNIEQIR